MKFSFIIGTLNRKNELEWCLDSLFNQMYKDFEIIIIDQSIGDETEKFVKEINDRRIIYKHVKFQGLSKARNEAIRLSSGDYVCLIDDDAYYMDDYLEKLSKYYLNNKNIIISGYMWDAKRKKEFINYKNLPNDRELTVRQIIRYCPSPVITFPINVIKRIGGFDEKFGVGAQYGAGEETDFLLRAYWCGYKILHYKNIKAEHPHSKASFSINNTTVQRKTYNYSYGIGAMYKKQICLKHAVCVSIPLAEQLIKMVGKCILRKKNSSIELSGFYNGFRDYNSHQRI